MMVITIIVLDILSSSLLTSLHSAPGANAALKFWNIVYFAILCLFFSTSYYCTPMQTPQKSDSYSYNYGSENKKIN